MNRFICAAIAILLLTGTIFSPIASAIELDAEAQRWFYSQNDQIYYDDFDCNPDEQDEQSSGSSTYGGSGKIPEGNKNIYITGDSITEGSATKYKNSLKSIGYDATVIAKHSMKIDWGLAQMDSNLDSLKSAGAIIIAFGTNGGTTDESISTTIKKIKELNSSAALFWVDLASVQGAQSYVNEAIMSGNKAIYKNTSLGYSVIQWAQAVDPSVSPTSSQAPYKDANHYIKDDSYFVHPNSSGTEALSSLIVDAINKAAGENNSDTPSSSGVPENTRDYKGREIFTKQQLDKIKSYQPTYQASASKYNVPWQMLAVVHIRETNLGLVNPSNGQGLFQFYDKRNSGEFPPGPVSQENFKKQTDELAYRLANVYAGKFREQLKNNDPNAVKYAFFSYNGRASVYITQGIKLGFSREQAEVGEGSPYVMNLADAKRDPSVAAPGTWGQVKRDAGRIEYPANNDYGAFVMYSAISGLSTSSTPGLSLAEDACSDTDEEYDESAGNAANAGGLSKAQAIRLVQLYGANKNNSSARYAGSHWNLCGGRGANCVTFSKWFINRFTSTNYASLGNGGSVVNTLKARGVPTGTEPKPFAVFSVSSGGYGHTGVVLGIESNGKVIVGNADCFDRIGYGAGDGINPKTGSAFINPTQYTKNTYMAKGKTTFAYVDVIVEEIEEYLKTGE